MSTATQATYTRPTVSPIGARISASSGGTTYVKTTSGSIITVVPKSLATLGGKIISSNIVSGESSARLDQAFNLKRSIGGQINHSALSTGRHNNEDHHHPRDLQAKCHCGSKNHRKGDDHSGTPWKECGDHTLKHRGQSKTFIWYCIFWFLVFVSGQPTLSHEIMHSGNWFKPKGYIMNKRLM